MYLTESTAGAHLLPDVRDDVQPWLGCLLLIYVLIIWGLSGPDSRRSAHLCGGVTYPIYVTPPQLRRASAVFSKHLLRKLRRHSVNRPGVSPPNSNLDQGGVFYVNVL